MATSSFTRKIEIKSKEAVRNFKLAERNAVKYTAKSDIDKELTDGIDILKRSLSR